MICCAIALRLAYGVEVFFAYTPHIMMITRCPSCRTSFKVVPDQLRLMQGWVKCGKCALAFNAEKHLVQRDSVSLGNAAAEHASPLQTPVSTDLQQPIQSERSTANKAPIPHTPTQKTTEEEEPPLFKGVTSEDAQDAYEDEKLSPKTLFPTDALDAIDELVALGAMRPAGTPAADGAQTSHPFPSTLPIDALIQAELQQAGKSNADPVQAEVEPALFNAPLAEEPMPQPAGTLESWRRSKAAKSHKQKSRRGWSSRKADLEPPLIGSNSPTEEEPVLHPTAVVAPWHPDEQKLRIEKEDEDQDDDKEPSFVAEARSRERWSHWSVRLLLSILLIAGSAFALAQAAYLNRHMLAASLPSTEPWLSGLCAAVSTYSPLPCDVVPLRRIEWIRVENHSLAADAANDSAGSSTPSYSLTITLKNQGELANAWPAFDIAFTDTTAAIQSRRVFLPKDYLTGADALRIQAQGIKSRDEQRVTLRFEAPKLHVGGYEITAFYP